MKTITKAAVQGRGGILTGSTDLFQFASFDGGKVTTKPLIFEGNRLVVNFSTSAAGSVQVEIQDKNGKPIDGYTLSDCPEIYGDEIEQTVKWDGHDVSSLANKPVRLHFVLRDADLFAFGFQTGR